MRHFWGAALVAAFVCLGSAAEASVCSSGSECRALGQKDATGDGVAVDHAAAAAAWTQGCDDKDARSCLELSKLLRQGWTLDVERDGDAANDRMSQALTLASAACSKGDGDGCLTIAMGERQELDREGWPKDRKDMGAEVMSFGKKACKAGLVEACVFVRRELWQVLNAELISADDLTAATAEATGELVELCKNGDGKACLEATGDGLKDQKSAAVITSQSKKLCDGGDADACMSRVLVLSASWAGEQPKADDPTLKEALADLLKGCEGSANELCPDVGADMLDPNGNLAKLGLHDASEEALKILHFQCDHGQRDACLAAASADKKKADDLLDRSCQLSPPLDPNGAPLACKVCKDHPGLTECKKRDTWTVSLSCTQGSTDSCELLGDRYRVGEGVPADDVNAAKSYKEACDASIKGACGKLDDLCHADGKIGHDLCAPSLLHTDVFYEAEWQMRTTQQATLSDGGTASNAAANVTLAGAAAAAQGGMSLERGHLDADLVVSVVLDRARQAAIKLVVDELESKSHGTGLRTYMRDLLAQGAQLLSDTTSLRRDALQDLGMTLVRAFAASNLVRTVLGDAAALRKAPVIGDVVASWSDRDLGAPALSAYLADLAYWTLGQEPLLQKAGGTDEPAPACPWSDHRKALCDLFTDKQKIEAALHVDGVLTALDMVRALDSAGTIDVRRLIEAIVQSTSIVDFEQTPGLDLSQWQSRIVDDLQHRFSSMRDRIDDVATLISAKTYADDGPDLVTLAKTAQAVKAFLTSADAAGFLDDDVAGDLAPLLALDKWASPNLATQITPDTLKQVRTDAKAALDHLGASWHTELLKKLAPVRTEIDRVTAQIAELGRDITAIRAVLKHHQADGVKVKEHLTIDDLPLGDLDELDAVFPKVVVTLDAIDTGVRDVLPNVDLRGLRFAKSSVVRLLGFLDLMSRVARSVRQTETVKQVIDTLALLGKWKDGQFTAPLFDMLQPVLDFIETRNPMPLEQLFAIIGRVRLDSLVTSLIHGDPCDHEGRPECWVFKIAYSLQESITKDGDQIKIDGAEVAKRLARFGDDFRRKHKGRWYFHLTVGMGSLYSKQADSGGGTRFAPLISEQIGFGWATPAMWHDRLTFKAGIAASGILYRMLLDNAESKSVMGEAFLAVDVYDLVEVYGAATAVAYPPTDMSKTSVEPGVAFGLSVPLSAYLEKL